MAAASTDVNFKEELSAIEQCELIPDPPLIFFYVAMLTEAVRVTGFKVLSEAERTAALYSLLQHSTQVQIRFFITVLQQMARSDPMTALLSPAMGGTSYSFRNSRRRVEIFSSVKVPCKARWKLNWRV